VSHYREFLEGLVEKVYEFGGGNVKECLGGIYEFLEKKKLDSLAQLELSKSPTASPRESVRKEINTPAPKQETQQVSNARLSYAEQREREKTIKRAEKKVAEAEAQIAAIEQEIKDIEDRIAAGDTEGDIFEKHAARNKALENAMSMWELACMELEELKG
ncbi:MAG: ABC transporter ATP-binding protein, partial [Muribaculaceae bacterium]|nr:ABC transporter ATP-binding protein [Muribaculaceae bacterium]